MKKTIFFLVLIFFLAGCAMPIPSPTATSTPIPTMTSTNTPQPTSTPTVTPTATPPPTATPIPTPTPAPLSQPVSNGTMEVRVITARFLDKVYYYYSDGFGFEYTPKKGYTILELGIKITNLNPETPLTIPWNEVYIIEEDKSTWYPNFGASYEPENKAEQVNPATLRFDEVEGKARITIKQLTYIRAIWFVIDKKPTSFLFGVSDSPLIEVPRK